MSLEHEALPSSALVAALRRLLRPLVRLLIAKQVSFPFFANLVKGLYIEVANQEFPISGRPQTDSRLSLLTGVHRRDVKRLRAELEKGDAIPSNLSFGSQLAARWNSEFCDEQGTPAPLSVQSTDEDVRSFEELVRSISKDIHPRSVLDECLRLGVVHFDSHGRVVLDSGTFVPRQDIEEKLAYLGRNLHDHMAAAVENVVSEEPPFMERSVHYGGLTRASANELSALAEEVGMRAMREVNQQARKLKTAGKESEKPGKRIHMGVYFYEADDSPPDDETDDA